MKSVYGFLVKPIGSRYNNKKKIGSKELILNTEIFNHQYINREAKVLSIPKIGKTNIKVGDTIIVHHNVFRRWHDVRGVEKNSRSYVNENLYIVHPDQIYLYKTKDKWIAPKGYCFIKPLVNKDNFITDKEVDLMGVVKYSDGTINENELIGVRPNSRFEFVIDGERLYRVLSNFITIKYEYQGNEKTYNPSWAQSS